jgi:hypothetical protein
MFAGETTKSEPRSADRNIRPNGNCEGISIDLYHLIGDQSADTRGQTFRT